MSICGLDELSEHCDAQVSHVLSILDPDWPVPEVFGTFGEHEKLELRFDDIIEECAEKIAPQLFHVEQLLAFGRKLTQNSRLLVHCHAGISRSSASLALLMAQAVPPLSGAEIFGEILRIRPKIWPNLRIVEMGDDILGRSGDLVRAAHGIYRLQLDRRPHLAEQFRSGGRAREVEAALAPDINTISCP